MCRYGQYGPYKEHFACFVCRKTFRQTNWCELSPTRRSPTPEERVVPCPQCGQPMHDMGLDFKSPPSDAIKQWDILEQLYAYGITFHACGCGGPGYRPRKRRDLEAFLEDAIPKSEGQRLIEKWAKRPATRK